MQKDLFNDITKKTYSNLRIPYMGSKNKISHDLMYKMLEYKPNAKYFVDCCGGGASLSFLAIQMGLKVHYNDLQTDLVNFVEYIIGFTNQEYIKSNEIFITNHLELNSAQKGYKNKKHKIGRAHV